MGKTAFQILHERHPNSFNYLEMKKLLTDPSHSGFQFSEDIPEMRNALMVVLALIATMAFQSVISPPGGVWNEDGNKSSHKAGEAVMASTHPDRYNNIMNASNTAFFCCLSAMLLLTVKTRHAVYPYFFLMLSTLTICSALIAILITFSESMKAITPDEVRQSKGNKIIAVLMMVLGILGVIPIFVAMASIGYRMSRSLKRQQPDLGAEAFPLRQRLLYWTFQHLDMHTILRALR